MKLKTLLFEVALPYTLRSIIDLLENITGVHEEAYVACTSLETVTFKSSTVQFGRDVFGNCPS